MWDVGRGMWNVGRGLQPATSFVLRPSSFVFPFNIFENTLQSFRLFWIIGEEEIPVAVFGIVMQILQQEVEILIERWLGGRIKNNLTYCFEIALLPEFYG